MTPLRAVTYAAAMATVLLAACSAGLEGTKAGSDDRPVTLRLATVDPPGRPASDDVEEFARNVEELSDGAVLVEIIWEAHELTISSSEPRPYQTLADMVRDGDADVGLVPDFVWRDLGVTSLIALRAPFLITTDELVWEVVTSELAGQMLAGLDAAGVVGLTLLPETLRHPIGFVRPFLTLDDFAGAALRTLDDADSAELLRALGAEAASIDEDTFVRAVAAGEVHGADSAFAQHGSLPAPGTFTGNITFYPKMNVLVANAAVIEGLDDNQQAVLREAAALTLGYVLDTNPSDEESARDWCDMGGGIALATEADVAAIEREAEPIYAELERDEQTGSFISEIRTMKETVGPTVASIEPCDAVVPPVLEAGEDDPSPATAFPEGAYRMEMTAETFIAAGIDEATAYDHAGIWTLTFEGGTLSIHDGCEGTYSVDDSRVSLLLGSHPACGTAAGGELFSAAWTVGGDQLWFTDIRSGVDGPRWQVFHETLWGSQPWAKID